MEVLLCKKTLAKMFGVSPRTIENMVTNGRLPRPLRLSEKTLRWRATDISELLNAASAAANGGSQ